MAEGFLFSRLLSFSRWQVALMAGMYVILFIAALLLLRRFVDRHTGPERDLALWRILSLAPMLVVVIGSFVSLPVLLLIAAVGR